MQKVIFLDRDGTINEEVDHLYRVEDLVFIDGAIQAIKLFNQEGYKVVLVTNQAGIAKKLYTEADVLHLHTKMEERLNLEGAHIDTYMYCPYHVDGVVKEYCIDSLDRKPHIGMFLKYEKEHKVDKGKSWMIGDRLSDVEAGINYGVHTILLGTGFGKKIEQSLRAKSEYFFEDLLSAARFIVSLEEQMDEHK